MTVKISSFASVLLSSFVLWYSTGIASGHNVCTYCYPHIGICNVTSVGYAVATNNAYDLSLVQKVKVGDTVVDPVLHRCVNHGYRIIGNVSNSICFWTVPIKCEAVIPNDILKNIVIVRQVCRACASYCGCELYKNSGSSLFLNGYTPTICFGLMMGIKFLYLFN